MDLSGKEPSCSPGSKLVVVGMVRCVVGYSISFFSVRHGTMGSGRDEMLACIFDLVPVPRSDSLDSFYIICRASKLFMIDNDL